MNFTGIEHLMVRNPEEAPRKCLDCGTADNLTPVVQHVKESGSASFHRYGFLCERCGAPRQSDAYSIALATRAKAKMLMEGSSARWGQGLAPLELLYALEICRSCLEHYDTQVRHDGPEKARNLRLAVAAMASRMLERHFVRPGSYEYWDGAAAFYQTHVKGAPAALPLEPVEEWRALGERLQPLLSALLFNAGESGEVVAELRERQHELTNLLNRNQQPEKR